MQTAVNEFLTPRRIDVTEYNQNHELDLFDPSTGLGLTDEYLRDRAQLAVEVFQRNITDESYVKPAGPVDALSLDIAGALALPAFVDSEAVVAELKSKLVDKSNDDRDQIFADYARKEALGGNSSVVAFGSAGEDLVRGGYYADAFFGGDGDDTLVALPGDDYLEGGRGVDWLDAGQIARRLRRLPPRQRRSPSRCATRRPLENLPYVPLHKPVFPTQKLS